MDFIYTRNVQFADTDAAGVVHFSRILCYVEEAVHAFLTDKDITVLGVDDGWPLVKVDVDYRKPLRFGNELEINVDPISVGRTSVTWSFAVMHGEDMAAEGIITTVHVDGNARAKAIPVVLQPSS